MEPDQLGALVREFRTDIRRRRRTGAVLTVVGLVIFVLAVALAVGALTHPGVYLVAPIAIPGAIGLLAIAQGRMLLRVPRSETLELREGGLVQRTDQGDRVMRWTDIPLADYRCPPPTGTYTPGRVARRTGLDVHVLVWPVDGKHIRITSHTAGAADLVAALREHVPHGDSPTGKWFAVLCLIGAVVILGVVALGIFGILFW